jgi:hypothetical protein
LRDVPAELREGGLLPELTGVKTYDASEFRAKVDWMLARGLLPRAPKYEDSVRSE